MLRIVDGSMKWGSEDVVAMARVLDADQAVKRSMPLVPSVILLAERNNVQLSRLTRLALESWKEETARLNALAHSLLKMKMSSDGSGDPNSLWNRLFNHQAAALHFMHYADRHAFLLADQVGVGKTAVALSFIRDRTTNDARVLVVCMNSAKRQWRREIRRWVPNAADVRVVEGSIAEQQATVRNGRVGYTIGHWESLVHASEAYLAAPWSAVILDEAHMIGNRDTYRAKVAHRFQALIRLALTAHPYANGPHELWSILHFLYPQTYNSYWRFFAQHVAAAPKPFGGFEIIGVRRPNLLKRELRPICVQRSKRDVRPDLPAVTRVPVEVDLSARGRREYAKLRKQFFVELEAHKGETKILAIPSVLARITRLRQYLVDPGLVGAREPSAKYPAILETLGTLDGPPVIFTLFQQAIPRLTRVLERAGYRCAAIDGTVKSRERDRAQRDFLRGKLGALLVSAGAGGTSLNLGKYGYVIHLDLPWTARDFEQTEGRVDRPEEGTGISVPTTSFRVIVSDSYEARMEERLEKKHGMYNEVFSYDLLKALFA